MLTALSVVNQPYWNRRHATARNCGSGGSASSAADDIDNDCIDVTWPRSRWIHVLYEQLQKSDYRYLIGTLRNLEQWHSNNRVAGIHDSISRDVVPRLAEGSRRNLRWTASRL